MNSLQVADSFLVAERHGSRDLTCTGTASPPPVRRSASTARAFWDEQVGRLPRLRPLVPPLRTLDRRVTDEAPRLALQVRPAPPQGGRIRVAVHEGPDPRTNPRVKGPDLELLGALKAEAAAAQRRRRDLPPRPGRHVLEGGLLGRGLVGGRRPLHTTRRPPTPPVRHRRAPPRPRHRPRRRGRRTVPHPGRPDRPGGLAPQRPARHPPDPRVERRPHRPPPRSPMPPTGRRPSRHSHARSDSGRTASTVVRPVYGVRAVVVERECAAQLVGWVVLAVRLFRKLISLCYLRAR